MNVAELRIGNFVEMNNKIIVMDTRIFHAVIHGFEGYEPNPVKITKDQLLKFGFEADGHNWFNKYYSTEFKSHQISFEKMCVAYNLESKRLCVFEVIEGANLNNIFPIYTGKVLDYVHEIQNFWFVFTGEELINK
jgi:hypothetical protein